MQLTPAAPTALRRRLGAAVCLLLAAGLPGAVRAAEAPAARWQLDATGLVYSEKARASIVEPVGRITRLFPNGQQLWAQVALDAMTGASPSGQQPSGQVQTTTTASGTVTTHSANEVPTKPFKDFRSAFDAGVSRPLGGSLTLNAAGHFSHEKDYQSAGGSGGLAVDLDHHLFTLSLGGAVNHDQVRPVGGVRVGLTDGTQFESGTSRPKTVTDLSAGITRVLTRRWLLGLSATREREEGYLTEPYKVVSVLDVNGYPVAGADLTEKRPTTRDRTGVQANSVYHLERDVVYTSWRYYRDDWGVHSHTFDVRYRNELPDGDWLEPHARFYQQTQADFFGFGLPAGQPLPKYASSDFRLGPLRTLTLGLTYGFQLPEFAGEFTLRGEYLRQWGDGDPASAIGVQKSLDLFPPVDIASIVIGYSLPF